MKETIGNFIRFFTLVYTMTMGFFFIYALLWFAVGLPQTNWAIALLAALAGLSEFGYISWIRK